jgi:hypothetical protein
MYPIVIVIIVIFLTTLIIIIGNAIRIYCDRKKIESETPIITNLLSHKSVNSDYNLI